MWTVVPVVTRENEIPVAVRRARAALAPTSVTVADDEDTSVAFERIHSADPTPIAANDIERWASRSRDALYHLSRGDYESARRALLEAQAISERAADALNRETMRARQVLDTCLFVVRASLETGDVDGAERQARHCRRLVPRMHATSYTHTPEVRALVARIDAELDAEIAGSLSVESSPPGCNVRINGVFFGPTPLTTSDIPQGEYRVQVECDDTSAGRVHRVSLGERDVVLRVDAAFDRVVRARPALALVYPDAASARARMRVDGIVLARTLGRRIVLARAIGDDLVLVAVDDEGEVAEEIAIDLGSASASRRIANYLDAEVAGPTEPEAEERARDPRPRHVGVPRWVLAVGSVGAASTAASVVLLAVRSHRGRLYDESSASDPGYLDAQRGFVALRPAVLATAAIGALGSSIGASAWLRRSPHRRPIAWSLGFAGLGLASWALVEATRAPGCVAKPICAPAESAFDRAIVLGAIAASAISVPLGTIGSRRRADTSARLVLDRDLAWLSVGGRWR